MCSNYIRVECLDTHHLCLAATEDAATSTEHNTMDAGIRGGEQEERREGGGGRGQTIISYKYLPAYQPNQVRGQDLLFLFF